MSINKMSRQELELTIIDNDIMEVSEWDDSATDEELITVIGKWIEEGDECAAS